jgi:tetratricopeptide (TPR) repeat protein
MATTVTFEVRDEGGIFRHGIDERNADLALDEFLEKRADGRFPLNRYVSGLKGLVERHTDFIDGYAHLCFAFLEQGDLKKALEAGQQGVALGRAAIPAGFKGAIEWGWIENRPFLRATQGLALCHQRLGQRREAIELMERLLTWNPNDNQGLRFLIGSEYLRSGNKTKASRLMKREADHYPPYHYELVLIDLIAGRTVDAATRLRRGFIFNGYVAEVLCGNPDPPPLAIWHGSNLAEPGTARVYVEHYGDLWHNTPIAIPFLRWLHTHPKVLAERSRIYEIKEELLWERDFERRRALGDREERFTAEIDDTLSNQIVVKRSDRNNKPVDPWLYPITQPKYAF